MRVTPLIINVLALPLFFGSVRADPVKPAPTQIPLSGEIKLESFEKKHTDPYASGQDAAIAWMESLASVATQASTGSKASSPIPNETVINHLGATYLLCSIREGTCPRVLEALLEADVLRSVESGRAECPTLSAFWESYLENDFENRHKYQVKTGFLNATSDFKRDVRPRFIRCKETVEQELSKINLAKRYSANGPAMTSINDTLDLLRQIKASQKNVFNEVGVK